IQLSIIGQKAGLNGAYMADFSDKSQFYKFGQQVPCHNN
ncbi:MAG: bacteriocin immunity protein, partial [Lactococcus sp.]|nr:bacteriocin immunity protein [Lactococcus sp.]